MSTLLQQAGFIKEQFKYERWYHPGTNTTCLRQPYMNDEQWAAHQQHKVALHKQRAPCLTPNCS